MITTITGPNDLARREAIEAATAAHIAEYGDMALEKLDGAEDSVERMVESAQSLPFLCPKKLVILREPSKQKTFIDHVDEIIAASDEATDIIIDEPKLDKRSSYYKKLRKETDFKEFGELDTPALVAWLTQYAETAGGALTRQTANFLIQRVGVNQLLLKSELDKLLAYNPTVSEENIKLLCDPSLQSTIFELMDAAFAGNHRRALELYDEQRAQQVDPRELIGLLVWQLHTIALVKSMGQVSSSDIASKTKLRPFVIQKTSRITSRLSMRHIKSLIADLLSIDQAAKVSSIDLDEALRLYLLKLGS